jgi:hypothetical protein
MLFGTEPQVITCPLCRGARDVDNADENILMRDPWRVTQLIREAQGWSSAGARKTKTTNRSWVARLADTKIARWFLGRKT